MLKNRQLFAAAVSDYSWLFVTICDYFELRRISKFRFGGKKQLIKEYKNALCFIQGTQLTFLRLNIVRCFQIKQICVLILGV